VKDTFVNLVLGMKVKRLDGSCTSDFKPI